MMKKSINAWYQFLISISLCSLFLGYASAEENYPLSILPTESDPEFQTFDDFPEIRNINYPDWFKDSFLNLQDDMEDAKQAGKKGIILYFGQQHCPYCENMLHTSLSRPDIEKYILKYFDPIAIDMWGNLPVTSLDGVTLLEKDFSDGEKVLFSPTIMFIDTQGNKNLTLKGYYPPYVFRAAVDFVVGESYKTGSFRDFLAKVKSQKGFNSGMKTLSKNPLFKPLPYDLGRNKTPAKRPLVVLFEQPECYACDIFHAELLSNPEIASKFQHMDVIQLDMWQDTAVVTPPVKKPLLKHGQKNWIYFLHRRCCSLMNTVKKYYGLIL